MKSIARETKCVMQKKPKTKDEMNKKKNICIHTEKAQSHINGAKNEIALTDSNYLLATRHLFVIQMLGGFLWSFH